MSDDDPVYFIVEDSGEEIYEYEGTFDDDEDDDD